MSCNNCDTCLTLSFVCCDDMEFIVGVTKNTSYNAIITAPNGIKYTQTTTANGSGNIVIDISKFPDELFNPYAGIFTLEVETTTGKAVTLINGYTDYTCVSFDIYKLVNAN